MRILIRTDPQGGCEVWKKNLVFDDPARDKAYVMGWPVREQ